MPHMPHMAVRLVVYRPPGPPEALVKGGANDIGALLPWEVSTSAPTHRFREPSDPTHGPLKVKRLEVSVPPRLSPNPRARCLLGAPD